MKLAHKLRRRRGLGGNFRLAVLALIVAAVVTLGFILSHPPEDSKAQSAAESFIITMQSNNADKAYGMGNDSFRSATTEDTLHQLFDQIEPFLSQSRIEKVDSYYAVSGKGLPRAIFVYTASKNSKVTYIRIVMDKQTEKTGKWLVHSLITKAQPLQAKPE